MQEERRPRQTRYGALILDERERRADVAMIADRPSVRPACTMQPASIPSAATAPARALSGSARDDESIGAGRDVQEKSRHHEQAEVVDAFHAHSTEAGNETM